LAPSWAAERIVGTLSAELDLSAELEPASIAMIRTGPAQAKYASCTAELQVLDLHRKGKALPAQ
jgi:hypothetical protein